MAIETKIQWCDATFNPWRGCVKVAAGCANCYAEAQSKRNPGVLGIWGADGSRVVAAESQWRQVEKLELSASVVDFGDRPRVFVGSMMDWAEDWQGAMVGSKGERLFWSHCRSEDNPSKWHWITEPHCAGGETPLTMDDVRRRLFRLIDACPNVDFLLLTKRPERIRECWANVANETDVWFHRPNVWLITSIANQEDADRNIPHLLKCRDLAPVLGVSAEPLVGPVDLVASQYRPTYLAMLDWVIVGGESGPNARTYNIEWSRSIIEQCRAAGVAVFHKQLGAWPVDVPAVFAEDYRIVLNDPKGGDPSEWPEDLRVREFPEPRG